MAKAAAKRNVGMEILEGLRQLKRGEVGRVVNVPSVDSFVNILVFRRNLPHCLVYRCAHSRNGSKDVVRLLAQLGHSF